MISTTDPFTEGFMTIHMEGKYPHLDNIYPMLDRALGRMYLEQEWSDHYYRGYVYRLKLAGHLREDNSFSIITRENQQQEWVVLWRDSDAEIPWILLTMEESLIDILDVLKPLSHYYRSGDYYIFHAEPLLHMFSEQGNPILEKLKT